MGTINNGQLKNFYDNVPFIFECLMTERTHSGAKDIQKIVKWPKPVFFYIFLHSSSSSFFIWASLKCPCTPLPPLPPPKLLLPLNSHHTLPPPYPLIYLSTINLSTNPCMYLLIYLSSDLAIYRIMHSKNTRIVLTELGYLSCNCKAAKDTYRCPNIPFWGFIPCVRL